MARLWAIAVGVHRYQALQPLPHAEQDANMFSQRLRVAASVAQVYCFADQAPDLILDGGASLSSQPTFTNLTQFLQLRFSTPFLEPDDILCFLFSGHGLQFANQDYLMFLDSDPACADQTALSVDDLVFCLKRSGTANIVLLLDACHTEYQQFGQGFGTDPKDVITIFGANYGQCSRVIPNLQQGSFTQALLEGWRSLSHFDQKHWGHLYHYIRVRLPTLNRQFGQPHQAPRLRVDPPLVIESIPLPKLREEIVEPSTPLITKQRMPNSVIRFSNQ
ncbi:MAG: caspase family protein [Leptolyngbyaceae cyanobacterium bins.349]|nr:caspase family protein [Leptolyngbyaceae cyanobacterium bins.349]